MKVLMLNGSPNEKGCTFTALSVVAETLSNEGIDSEIVWVGNKPISGCIACGGCGTAKKCVVSDDVNDFVKKAAEADGFVIGSPVHYAGMSGTLKSFLDRAFSAGSKFESGNVFVHKPSAAVVSARRAGTTETYDQIIKYFGINQMPIVSSMYWNMVHGTRPSEILQDEEGIQVLRVLGKNLAYLLRCKEAGEEKGILPPEQEPKIRTNFIR